MADGGADQSGSLTAPTKGRHLKKHCKLWAPTWQKHVDWVAEAGENGCHSNGCSSPMLEINARKPSKVKAVDSDASYSVEGTDGGSFAIASSNKELKALMKSDAEVVYDERKGKLYLNENGTAKGWGKKKVGGLLATFKGKPELSADHFEGLSTHQDAVTSGGGGKNKGDTKEQIASYRDTLSDLEEADLLVDFTLEPQKALKRAVKVAKKDGYVFDPDELAEALDEMDKAGSFANVQLDDAALATLMNQDGEKSTSCPGCSNC